MEKIIKLSLSRLKKNFLRYFLVYVLGILMTIGLFLVFSLIAGLFYGLFLLLSKNVVVGVGLVIIYTIISLFSFIYLSSWLGLAQISALINDELKDVSDSFKKTKSLVLKYTIFLILWALFSIGLFYTNVLLLIPMLVWLVWGSFAVYSFLDNHRGGLMPLWYSKAKIKGHFWMVVLYVAVLYVAVGLLSTFFIQIDSRLNFVNGLLWFISTPFIISFSYELYRSLPEPKSVGKPKVWIALSIIGWLLYLAITVISLSSLKADKIKNLNLDKPFSQKQLQNWQNTKLN